MRKIFTFCFFFLSLSMSSVYSATGWFQDYVLINPNGAGSNYYWIGSNPNFGTQLQGHNFGTVSSLVITGCDMRYWSDTQDRTGGAFYYKIMSSDGNTQIVAPVEIIWTQSYLGGNDYQGFLSNLSIDLLSGLTANTAYQLHIWAKSWGTGQGDSWLTNGGANYVANFTYTPTEFTGTGSWNDFERWDGGIPIETSHAVISGSATISTDIIVNSLTINLTQSLIINSEASLTVNGTLTNNAGNTGIVIKSDASGTGSLITSNGVGATVERYVAGDWSSATSGWHQISSPVAAQALSAFETSGTNNGYDLYGWDEPTNTWKNYKDVGFATWNGSANFNVGQGYMISYEANQTKTFTGALNVSNVTRNDLSNTGGFWYTGWHLVGNPFSSAVQWNNGSWALTDVAGTCKIWNSASKSYSDIAANGIIPSAQGFMIKVADATNSITIPASARVHNSTNWYKSGNQTEKFFLIAAEQSGLSAQESQILVNPDATPEYDFDFDSHFLAGYAPQFYSIAGDINLSTNTLPSLPDDAIIPFGFVKNEATQFNITMQEQISGYIVYLNDLLTGIEHNLTDQPVYSFTSAEGDDPNRFLLYFAPVSVNKPSQGNAYGIYSYAGQVYISNTPSNAQITLSTLTGQVVMQRNTGGSGLVTLNAASLPKGVYIVTVQGEGARVSRKVVL